MGLCRLNGNFMNFESIAKDIVEAFMYISTIEELRDELQERFGKSDEPLLYQLQREISLVSQKDFTIVQRFTKLKKLWGELNCLQRIPYCTFGAAKALFEIKSVNHLV